MTRQVESGRPASRPTGTVTFLFSDIEGSTQRWDRDREGMQDALRRHDALMQTAIAKHDGYVFKTIGDAFCAAFARPEDAVAAILDAHRALAAEDFSRIDGLRVRAALHTGTADEREGDYFGPALNRIARLLVIGHGGQVVVSGVTTDLVQGALPPRASLRDLGEHRLRDLARPEQVYQLVSPDLAADVPPLRSLDLFPNNLPLQLKSFVGRDAEIAEITALIEQHRLVTLVGSAGVGKTRTALQVAANLLDGSADGVWFIELAPLASGDYIPSTVAQALGLTLPSAGDAVENLVRAVKGKRALFVFDNCEHLIEPAARAISAILHGCPKVKVLASSRQGLGIDAEETYRMPSLEIPPVDTAGHLSAADATRSAAIALFVDRAAAVDKRFTLADENAAVVADICRRLDGIPLAIELAASRVRILSPRQLRERLDERFRVLTGGSRDVLPRQQTLRALIDWSHDLLDERERGLFRRLGIFVNGFTLEGAVAVGGGDGDGFDEIDVFDVLSSLVDKSLVLAEPAGDSVRYRFLESTRIYASEKLSGAGERELIADRHLHYQRSRFAELRVQWEKTARRADINDVLATELDNVRAALDAALTKPDILAGGWLLAEIGMAWEPLGLRNEGITRNEAFLAALPPRESLLLARLSTPLADMLAHANRSERALDLATRAVAYARASGDGATLADALQKYAFVSLTFGTRGDAEAEKALAEAESIPDTSAYLRLQFLFTRAQLCGASGDTDTAVRIWEQLRQRHRSLGNTHNEVVAVLNLAEIEHEKGKTEQAIALVREILPLARRGREMALACSLLVNLAGYLVASDDLPGAIEAAYDVIGPHARRESDDAQVALVVEHLALAYALRGEFARASILEGYAASAFRQLGFNREFTETTTYERLTLLLREGLAANEFARRADEGAALTAEAAIALALQGLDLFATPSEP
jgi:predicted ATPase/class 3 adenylate cyclase